MFVLIYHICFDQITWGRQMTRSNVCTSTSVANPSWYGSYTGSFFILCPSCMECVVFYIQIYMYSVLHNFKTAYFSSALACLTCLFQKLSEEQPKQISQTNNMYKTYMYKNSCSPDSAQIVSKTFIIQWTECFLGS